ncbi:hypothetical protein DFJ73DRAFT_142511 [Zopfochytrium polystomum]|nr:hypothetical protein DFJ73DRAFT_142511 [Zopfochytrium polystomum]
MDEDCRACPHLGLPPGKPSAKPRHRIGKGSRAFLFRRSSRPPPGESSTVGDNDIASEQVPPYASQYAGPTMHQNLSGSRPPSRGFYSPNTTSRQTQSDVPPPSSTLAFSYPPHSSSSRRNVLIILSIVAVVVVAAATVVAGVLIANSKKASTDAVVSSITTSSTASSSIIGSSGPSATSPTTSASTAPTSSSSGGASTSTSVPSRFQINLSGTRSCVDGDPLAVLANCEPTPASSSTQVFVLTAASGWKQYHTGHCISFLEQQVQFDTCNNGTFQQITYDSSTVRSSGLCLNSTLGSEGVCAAFNLVTVVSS